MNFLKNLLKHPGRATVIAVPYLWLTFAFLIRCYPLDITNSWKTAQAMSKKPLRLIHRDGFTMLDIGTMEIWDGTDMALLRESLTRLIKVEKHRAIAIDLTYVKYIPSGFFGMLFDWQEKSGTRFALTPPQPNVQRMLWFRQFFKLGAEGLYEMQLEPTESIIPTESPTETCLSSQTA